MRKTLSITDSATTLQSPNYGGSPTGSTYRLKAATYSQSGDIQDYSPADTPLFHTQGDHVNSRYLKCPIGVFARSSRIMLVKSSVAAKVEQVLSENGISPKPSYPTKECCDKYNELKVLVQTLTGLKKHADRLVIEYKKLKSKANTLNGELT